MFSNDSACSRYDEQGMRGSYQLRHQEVCSCSISPYIVAYVHSVGYHYMGG
jgi:hypothetical protein